MAASSTFAFRAMDMAGVASSGEVEGDSKSHVSEQLRQRGLIVLDVSEKRGPVNLEDFLRRWKSPNLRELSIFSRQFATLVASGMPMLRTLYTLEEQTEDELLKEAVGGVRQDVEAGASLEQAMSRHPKVFDTLFRAMVRSGEQSGRLEETLDRIAFQVEKLDSLRRQVRSALLYPAFVFLLAITVMVVAVGVIVPGFVGVFQPIALQSPRAAPTLSSAT